MITKTVTVLIAAMCSCAVSAQDLVHYSGTTLSNPNFHDGGLAPAIGVHNIQVMRANREHPSEANGMGWTYNHQPMLVYWRGKFYLHYLSDLKDEQVPPSHTLICSSADGYHWSAPRVLFPEYHVPEGYHKEGVPGVAHNLIAVMHQRQGFYTSSEGRLYALGTYGICMNPKDHNNDGNGIGRVIREIKSDGTFGPIYFIYYNHGFGPQNTDFPNYKKGDKHLRKACEEIYANPRMLMGWVEEADRGDSILPLKKEYKAYNDYTLPDGRIVALWKHAVTSISSDGGHTWLTPCNRAAGFVNSNAKIWGQRLSDGTYATVYNPSEYRWPLAISLSADGIDYNTLNLVCGEVPPMRYGGNYKSYGPQYIRGIQEGNQMPPDSDMWLAYSMNKEDIWTVHIPVPVQLKAHAHANDDFSKYKELKDLRQWNIYSPIMAPVSLQGKWLVLRDEDPFDYCRVERVIPETKKLTVDFDIQAEQNNTGELQIEFLDDHGTAASRIDFTPQGEMRAKGGARYGHIINYVPGQTYHISASLSTEKRMLTVYVDGKKKSERMLYAPVSSFSRVAFRTGERRTKPDVDTPADWNGTLPDAGKTDSLAEFRIANFNTCDSDLTSGAAFLNADDYKQYVDYFNSMEEENIVQAIPNSLSWQWMKENVPLFECSDKDFERMWYYRWWTIRKHIEKTPEGYGMTEFLVHRNYADKYNLISSALGHHIHESRWLRNPKYLDGILRTWFHGNNGKPLAKLDKYSSWTPASIWDRFLVDGDTTRLVAMLPEMEWEFNQWNNNIWKPEDAKGKKLPRLYWQYDVRDAMEETISGGRHEKNARPSINSYMFGNAMSVALAADISGDKAKYEKYYEKAKQIKQLSEDYLWNKNAAFFEVMKPDSSSNVREEIGFIPWYFGLPKDNATFASAWLQAADSKGFSAPYGFTTAEQRHPLFRSHGTGKCEWDGAVWPFASSQTLTALANFINDYPVGVKTLGKDWLDSLYFSQMEKYVQSQSHRGKPYIGEYLDETTGYWLKGDQERSRYYNHSTFCDLIITGLIGLRPQAENELVVNPLVPGGKWDYFCLDNVLYHGHNICIVYDKTGMRYHAGKGLQVYVDGKLRASKSTLGRIVTSL